jgi:hypothetical protein
VYSGRIDTSGAWMIWKFPEDAPDSAQTLAQGASRAIRTAGVNRIEFECLGDPADGSPVTLKLAVNGTHVGQATDAAGSGFSRVGLHVLSLRQVDVDLEVRFDNFSVERM